MNKLAIGLGLVASALTLSAFVGGCAPGAPGESDEELAVDGEEELRQFCGGIAGFPCPEGQVCTDDPNDGCDPMNGGADCGGVCRKAKKPSKKHCNRNDREYVATDAASCAAVRFFCADGMTPFFDECGCGCEVAPGEACGSNVCGEGEYCCNESCGQCAPVGGFCTQQYCGSVCGPNDCGPALGMPNYICDDGVTVAGPTGNCLAQKDGACGWEVIGCP